MESDGDIEYLDEDADIVQQCVQVPVVAASAFESTDIDVNKIPLKLPLLVERSTSDKKRKRKTEEYDSDYDPELDPMVASPATKKKKVATRKQNKLRTQSSPNTSADVTLYKTYAKTLAKAPAKAPGKAHVVKTPVKSPTKPLDASTNRKKMNIRIPDYEDPLCLPVRALGSDLQRLRNWNNACMEHFKHSSPLLRPEKGHTKRSTRTLILRNIAKLREAGKTETAVWMKTCVENEEGFKKSEIFQCILPKYREKKVIDPYTIFPTKKRKIHHVSEVLLTKENHKDGEALVVYTPTDSTSAVYKYAKDDDSMNFGFGQDKKPDDGTTKRVLWEVAFCKVCAPCYQTSWRGTSKQSEKKKIQCPICARTTISVYNLLTHLKAHSREDVQHHKLQVSAKLAEAVGYHYRCRVCQRALLSIRELRAHIAGHKGSTPFRCEIGNHRTS